MSRNENNPGVFADVLMDRWFKRTFGWKPAKRLTTLLLRLLIPERDIAEISFGPQEHVNPLEEGKDVRLDVECTDSDGTRFMVEMQLSPQMNFYKRAVFNSSFGIQEQMEPGDVKYNMRPIYFIGVMCFSVHKGSDKVSFRYQLRDTDSGELMTDSLQYIFLELPNSELAVEKGEATILDKFCYVLYNMSQWESRPDGYEGEIFDLLFNSSEISKFAGSERSKYFEDMHSKQDIENMIDFAREEGREKYLKEGREEERNLLLEKARTLLAQGKLSAEALAALEG